MIVSLEWLKDYTDVHVSPEEFCERMIMSGSNLETLELVGEDMKLHDYFGRGGNDVMRELRRISAQARGLS